MGEIKTVIDEAETQNIAMNSIYLLKVQEVVYRLYTFFSGETRPTFMSVMEYSERLAESMNVERRPDLLNRIENFLISMSHSFDQHVDEQLKQMRELKEQVVIIMQQLDVLKKRLVAVAAAANDRVRLGGGASTDGRKFSVFGTDEPRLSRLIELSELGGHVGGQSDAGSGGDVSANGGQPDTNTADKKKTTIARNTTF